VRADDDAAMMSRSGAPVQKLPYISKNEDNVAVALVGHRLIHIAYTVLGAISGFFNRREVLV
jgi:hypothetical protein